MVTQLALRNRTGYLLNQFLCSLLMDAIHANLETKVVTSILGVVMGYDNQMNLSANKTSHCTDLMNFFLREGVTVTYDGASYIITSVDRAKLTMTLQPTKNPSGVILLPLCNNRVNITNPDSAYSEWKNALRVGDVVDVKPLQRSSEEYVPAIYKGKQKMQDNEDYVFSYMGLSEKEASFHDLFVTNVCVSTARC